MTIRTTSKTVTFSRPFFLKGVDRLLPPGDYRVVTDEELIEGLSFPAYASSLPEAVCFSSIDEFGRSSSWRPASYLLPDLSFRCWHLADIDFDAEHVRSWG
jgi:hypothetical protein